MHNKVHEQALPNDTAQLFSRFCSCEDIRTPPSFNDTDKKAYINPLNSHLPRKTSSIFVLVLVSQATCGLDVEVSVQLINQHKVDVELLAVELQT